MGQFDPDEQVEKTREKGFSPVKYDEEGEAFVSEPPELTPNPDEDEEGPEETAVEDEEGA